MDRKKTENWTQPDRFGLNCWLQLHTFLDGLNAHNRTDFNCLKIPLENTFKMHLKTLKIIKI